jgi:hypothetical protein
MKSTLIKLSLFLFLFSCSDSKEDLTQQVRTSIEKELTKKNIELYGLETKIIDLVLVKKGEYEYQGVLTTHETRTPDSKFYNSNDTTDNLIVNMMYQLFQTKKHFNMRLVVKNY